MILITGSTGYIGTRLCKRLKKDGIEYDEWLKDIATMRKEDAEQYDMVVHLAALTNYKECYEKLYEYLNVNCFGAINVVESCTNTKLILVSTCDVVGNKEYKPDPLNPYAMSKYMGERWARYKITKGQQICIFRPATVYGPGQGKLIDHCIKSGAYIELDHEVTLDFVHVDDVIDALVYCINNFTSGVKNVCNSKHKISQVAERIQKLNGFEPNVHIKSDGIPEDRVSEQRVKFSMDGWEPKISLDEGLRRIVEPSRN